MFRERILEEKKKLGISTKSMSERSRMHVQEETIGRVLNGKTAELSTYFSSYDKGWHDAVGTFTYDGRDTIKFNIDLGTCIIPNESKITLKHAVVTESASIYEAGKTVIILGLWYDKLNSYGELSTERIWLKRERPDMSSK